MLKKIASPSRKKTGGRFAIIAARYNGEYTDALVMAAEKELRTAEAAQIEIIRVPGSFEIPVVAAILAHARRFDAIICFGAILRGKTTHAQQIADGVTSALARIQIETLVPVIHGVLLFENEQQARERCLGTEHNRGTEAARVALEMREVIGNLKPRKRS
jgi:6,7-dimethyl-8-ribityllumazine synthase